MFLACIAVGSSARVPLHRMSGYIQLFKTIFLYRVGLSCCILRYAHHRNLLRSQMAAKPRAAVTDDPDLSVGGPSHGHGDQSAHDAGESTLEQTPRRQRAPVFRSRGCWCRQCPFSAPGAGVRIRHSTRPIRLRVDLALESVLIPLSLSALLALLRSVLLGEDRCIECA